jgi:hypothetical protein
MNLICISIFQWNLLVLLGPKLSVYASSCIPPAHACTQCN